MVPSLPLPIVWHPLVTRFMVLRAFLPLLLSIAPFFLLLWVCLFLPRDLPGFWKQWVSEVAWWLRHPFPGFPRYLWIRDPLLHTAVAELAFFCAIVMNFFCIALMPQSRCRRSAGWESSALEFHKSPRNSSFLHQSPGWLSVAIISVTFSSFIPMQFSTLARGCEEVLKKTSFRVMMLWRALVSCCCSSSQPVVVIVKSTNPLKSHGVFVMSDRSCNRDTRKCTPEAQATQTCKPTNLQVWGKNLSFFLNLWHPFLHPCLCASPMFPLALLCSLPTARYCRSPIDSVCVSVCLSHSISCSVVRRMNTQEKVVGSFPSDQDIYPLGCCKHGFCDHTSFPLCFSN